MLTLSRVTGITTGTLNTDIITGEVNGGPLEDGGRLMGGWITSDTKELG